MKTSKVQALLRNLTLVAVTSCLLIGCAYDDVPAEGPYMHDTEVYRRGHAHAPQLQAMPYNPSIP